MVCINILLPTCLILENGILQLHGNLFNEKCSCEIRRKQFGTRHSYTKSSLTSFQSVTYVSIIKSIFNYIMGTSILYNYFKKADNIIISGKLKYSYFWISDSFKHDSGISENITSESQSLLAITSLYLQHTNNIGKRILETLN